MTKSSGPYSIGPFDIDEAEKRITLNPGVYTLRNPIIFGLINATVVSELYYESEDGSGVPIGIREVLNN